MVSHTLSHDLWTICCRLLWEGSLVSAEYFSPPTIFLPCPLSRLIDHLFQLVGARGFFFSGVGCPPPQHLSLAPFHDLWNVCRRLQWASRTRQRFLFEWCGLVPTFRSVPSVHWATKINLFFGPQRFAHPIATAAFYLWGQLCGCVCVNACMRGRMQTKLPNHSKPHEYKLWGN